MEYNLQGRLSKITITTSTGTVVQEYTYDDNGIKVRQTQTGDGASTDTTYLVDFLNHTGYAQVLEETEHGADGNIAKIITYTIGHDVISQFSTAMEAQVVALGGVGASLFFLYDGHGSNRGVTDANGKILQRYNYDAYGNAIGFNPADAFTNLLYSGEQFNPTSGLQYLRARWYNPQAGRFNRVDPFAGNIDDPQSLHKYAYTHNNPIMGIDPSGYFSLIELFNVTTIIGMLSGALIGGIRGGAKGALAGLAMGGTLAFPMALLGLSISVGIAAVTGLSMAAATGITVAGFTTYGLYSGVDAYMNAENDRERIAACMSIVLVIGGATYSSYNIMKMPKLPPNSADKTLLFPKSKSEWGAFLSEIYAFFKGEVVVAREVTILSGGVRARVDLVTKNIFTGRYTLVESKYGPNANFTPNQNVVYQKIRKDGAVIVGYTADAAGMPYGTVLRPQSVRIDQWDHANPAYTSF